MFTLSELEVKKFLDFENGYDPVMCAFDIVGAGYDTLKIEWTTRGSFRRNSQRLDTFRLVRNGTGR